MTTSVMQILDATGAVGSTREIRAFLPRATAGLAHAEAAVRPVLADVQERGQQAVLDYTERFDHVRPSTLRVDPKEITAALAGLDSRVRAGLEEAIARARAVAQADVRASVTTSFAHDSTVTTRWLPVERVGVYVPGGLAAYPSTVIMNVVPAQVAGVESIAVASPPGPNGLPNPTVLATAALLGVDEVWAMGGAQAIAAFAYGFADQTHNQVKPGTDTASANLDPVNLITGPGNAFVAAAKTLVQSFVGVDTIAGPTEIIIVADETANPAFVAADLISQAEHDPMAAAVLVTPSRDLIDSVQAELNQQVANTTHAHRVRESLSGEQSALILVDSLDDAIRVANVYAGEHVEVITANAEAVAERIVNGGSVFVGGYSPVALGDYCSGSNHVLPTNGSAAFASALGVQSFLKGSQVINYSRSGLGTVADHIVSVAQAENLPAHAHAVSIRMEE